MFQSLDDKGECVGLYKDGELYFHDLPEISKETWNYVAFLKGLDIEYASIYANGSTLEQCCPESIKSDWQQSNNRLRAFINSLITAKVNLKENCFYDLVPQRFLKEYCELKNRICDHVFKTKQRPAEYTFFREFTELISDVASRELQIDRNRLQELIYLPQTKRLIEKVDSGHKSIKYNMFNSVTGRLTVSDRSFPILTLSSKLREAIKPTNDWFVALDLNAAEMRIALALAGENQTSGDLHEHIRSTIFGENYTRTQAKSISTQWLYDARNPETLKHDRKLSDFYNKEKLFGDYWSNGSVTTPYNRVIESDAHHVISYLCQSTLIDMFHRQILKIAKMLENKNTFISFMVHDSLVIDLSESEKNLLPDIIRELSNTPYGLFPVKVEIGPDYGNMKKMKIKV